MSCRVIGRRVEHFMMDQLINFSLEKGINTIIGKFIETERNEVVRNLYKDLGFTKINKNNKIIEWKINPKEYLIKNPPIKTV